MIVICMGTKAEKGPAGPVFSALKLMGPGRAGPKAGGPGRAGPGPALY